MLCLTFHFSGDLFDGDEGVSWQDGQGFGSDPGDPSLSSRQSCIVDQTQPDQVTRFRDGTETFDVWMSRGSSHISSIDLFINGTYS
jgi:hypothetical protein